MHDLPIRILLHRHPLISSLSILPQKRPSQHMHQSMLQISLTPIEIEFVSHKYCPVQFKFVMFSLQVALTLKTYLRRTLCIGETLYYLVVEQILCQGYLVYVQLWALGWI